MGLLTLLDSMHSLDPFLFRSRAEQAGIDADINPAYFAISAAEWGQDSGADPGENFKAGRHGAGRRGGTGRTIRRANNMSNAF